MMLHLAFSLRLEQQRNVKQDQSLVRSVGNLCHEAISVLYNQGMDNGFKLLHFCLCNFATWHLFKKYSNTTLLMK